MIISIVAAIGKNKELGYKNNLIFRIPNDLKYFKNLTNGHAVVMGRKTFESIGKPLPNRDNIVLTKEKLENENIKIITNYQEVFNLPYKEIFIIGGESIYKLFIDIADNLYLTLIDEEFIKADTYFPHFDENKYDYEVIKEESYNDLNYKFVRYKKR